MNINLPHLVLNDLLLIINAYGAYLKEKETLKRFKEVVHHCKTSFLKELEFYGEDIYSWECRTYGVTSGLSNDKIKDIVDFNEQTLISKINYFTKSLISSEKYYKKLKHQFNKKHPEYKDTMSSILKEHQFYFQENKRKQYKSYSDLTFLSLRFISFFRCINNINLGDNYLFNSFLHRLKHQNNNHFEKNDYFDKTLVQKLDVTNLNFEQANKKTPKKLTIKEIDYIFSLLDTFVANVSINDVDVLYPDSLNPNDVNYSNVKSLKKKIIRFKKLHSDYLTIRSKLE